MNRILEPRLNGQGEVKVIKVEMEISWSQTQRFKGTVIQHGFSDISKPASDLFFTRASSPENLLVLARLQMHSIHH